jgi:hypothetical protein
MSILEFVVYVGNNVKEETFGISSPSTLEDHEARQESRHAMNMTPNDPRTEASMCKSSGTQPENSEACMARIQALTVKETTSKTHMQVHTNKGSREKQPWRKPGPNRVELGLGRPAWADRTVAARWGRELDEFIARIHTGGEWRTDKATREGGSEWEPIKILLEGD